MSTYLVTGAAGFIGSALVRALLERGEQVRTIDNLSTGRLGNLACILGEIDFRCVDLGDIQALRESCLGVDCIFHEAAIPSVPRSIADPLASHVANVDGTFNLLLSARDAGVRRIVYASSSSIYGNTPILPKREDLPPNPISPYALQKLTGELYMNSFHCLYGLETVSLRYFNVFGPRQSGDNQYSGVLAKFITLMLKDQAPTIFGDGQQSRDYTFVDNVVEANLLAARAPSDRIAGKVFNIATSQRCTLNDAYNKLKGLTGFSGAAVYAAARAGEVRHSLADISAAREAFGYVPTVSFDEGLRRTVDWYRSQMIAVSEASGSLGNTQ